jgi:hypothetical protein
VSTSNKPERKTQQRAEMFLLVELATIHTDVHCWNFADHGGGTFTSTRRGSWKTLLLLSDGSGNVRYWHLADIPSENVRFWGKADIAVRRRYVR